MDQRRNRGAATRTLDRDRTRSAEAPGPSAPDFLADVPIRPPRSKRPATRCRLLLITRLLGALALLAVGAVHLHEYATLYSQIPTIGTLFLLNFLGATAIGLGLLAPLQRIAGRLGGFVVALFAAGGIALAAVAFVFLLISEHTPLFGFMEPGYDPAGITAARAAELATVLLLGSFLVARAALKTSGTRW
jgi:hypothetical protein